MADRESATERLVRITHSLRNHPFAYVAVVFSLLVMRLLAEASGDAATAVAIASNTDLFPLITKLVLGSYPFVLSGLVSLSLSLATQRLLTDRRVGSRLAMLVVVELAVAVLVLPLTRWTWTLPAVLATCLTLAAVPWVRRQRVLLRTLSAIVGIATALALGLFVRGTVVDTRPVDHPQVIHVRPAPLSDDSPAPDGPRITGVVVGYVLRQDGDLTYVLVDQPRQVVSLQSASIANNTVCSFGRDRPTTASLVLFEALSGDSPPSTSLPPCN